MPVLPNEMDVYVLNVGDGDSIIINFPERNGRRRYAVVDCARGSKTVRYLNDVLHAPELEFVCATHPHNDHINGIPELLTEFRGRVREFWDSGFRHTIQAYEDMLTAIEADTNLRYFRVTSGMERRINGVKVSILAPSMALRNRFDTYGIDMNNGSVVIMLEHDNFKMVLGGDAQFHSWSKVLEEYPNFRRTTDPEMRVQIAESFNPLNCNVLKVAHHCSDHGTSYECVETIDPEYAIVSCSRSSRHHFPHEIARMSLARVVGEDRVDERLLFTDYVRGSETRNGSIVVRSRGTSTTRTYPLHDDPGDVPPQPP